MINYSYLKLPEIVTIDPYTQRPRFIRCSAPSQRNVINMIPPEILAEIFLKLLEDDDMDQHHSTRPLVSRFCCSDPLLFGRICSYWRNVALHTPKLWSRIYVLKPQRSQVKLTRLWLERAGTHPLDLSIWAIAVDKYDQSAAIDILSLFMERRQYWMNISFTIDIQNLPILSQITTSEPSLNLLESATLWTFESSGKLAEQESTLDDIWRAIHACKTLRYVDWRAFYSHIRPDHCPWAQLTGLTLSPAVSFNQLLDVLSKTPQLEFLRVHSLSSTSDSFENSCTPSLVTHARLKKLNIALTEEAGPLFRLLSLPALQVLRIWNRFLKDTPRDVISFQRFLERSQSAQHLTIFQLDDLLIPEDDLRKYLQIPEFRNLNHIELSVKITDRILHQLANVNHQGRHEVLPSLEILTFSTGLLQITDGTLSDMVASRFSPHERRGSLKKIYVAAGNLGPIDQSALSEMLQQGLEGESGYCI
ncbi:hypothetical protein CPB84DRAFT_1788052 [Gymnopilus junonius]|uniref:F-box domain-containing protein n=1 Tax=Gymnopilus junonius TaxID=109634 RepID=A0A9P5NH02_GYMJU|nr:hypothetical protein CPB84DRAFT_1788052 [Gymnopilus junonius]